MASEELTAGRLRAWAPIRLPGILAAGLLLAALALLGLGWRATRSPITVRVDGRDHPVYTHAATVGAALHQAGIVLFPEDRVSPAPDTRLQPGLVVQVQTARPVALSVGDRLHSLRTHASTVGELVAEAGFEIGPADELTLDGQAASAGTPLPAGPAGSAGPGAPHVVLRQAAMLTLIDGGKATTLHSVRPTVGQVLLEAGITVYLADRVTPGLQEPVQAGMQVGIERSVPVQIVVDGRTIRTRSRATSVVGVLGEEQIALVGQDRAEPDLAAPLRPGMTIRVTRVREELAVEFEPIPFETVWVGDPQVEIDTTRLVQEGQVGLTKRRFRVRYEDGQEVARVLEDTWAEQAPITKTLAYGTKIVIRTMDTPDGPIEYWRKMRVYTTSYTAASSGKPRTHPRYGYTRLGWWLTKGIVAVDPEVIPLKTRLYVPGYGLARAGDTGGGVKGKFVDLGFDPHNYQSWHWWTDVYLLTPVPPASQIRWVLPNWPRYPDRRR